MRLLERGLAAQIGGAVALDFARTGLRCRIRLPADDGRGDAAPGHAEDAAPMDGVSGGDLPARI